MAVRLGPLSGGGRQHAREPILRFHRGMLGAGMPRQPDRLDFVLLSNKPKGEDYSVKDFDQQIASGIKVLEHMLLGKPVDLSHP
jgi:hypothetical protein